MFTESPKSYVVYKLFICLATPTTKFGGSWFPLPSLMEIALAYGTRGLRWLWGVQVWNRLGFHEICIAHPFQERIPFDGRMSFTPDCPPSHILHHLNRSCHCRESMVSVDRGTLITYIQLGEMMKYTSYKGNGARVSVVSTLSPQKRATFHLCSCSDVSCFKESMFRDSMFD